MEFAFCNFFLLYQYTSLEIWWKAASVWEVLFTVPFFSHVSAISHNKNLLDKFVEDNVKHWSVNHSDNEAPEDAFTRTFFWKLDIIILKLFLVLIYRSINGQPCLILWTYESFIPVFWYL